MDAPVPHDRFVFEGFCLDRRSGGLFRLDSTGGATPVTIGSRALDVLDLLLSRPGELLSKQAIMQAVWPGMVVEEKNLTVQIATLRRVLDDGRTDRSCIQTEAGRGYRFVAPVTRKQRDGLPPATSRPDLARCDSARRGGGTAIRPSTATAVSHDGCSSGGRRLGGRSSDGVGLERRVDWRRQGRRRVSQSPCCRSRTWTMTPRTTTWRTRSRTILPPICRAFPGVGDRRQS